MDLHGEGSGHQKEGTGEGGEKDMSHQLWNPFKLQNDKTDVQIKTNLIKYKVQVVSMAVLFGTIHNDINNDTTCYKTSWSKNIVNEMFNGTRTCLC